MTEQWLATPDPEAEAGLSVFVIPREVGTDFADIR